MTNPGTIPSPDANRRDGPDRRKVHPLLADWRWAFKGRRHGPRRVGEPGWVDHYDMRLVGMTIVVIALSGLDAFLTLNLLGTGLIREANPLMKFLIEHDVQTFVNLKTALTASGLLLMVVASHATIFGGLRVRTLLHAVLGLYVLLIGYELTLLRKVGMI